MQCALVFSLLLVGLIGCAALPLVATPTPTPGAPLVIYADAALSNVLRDIGTAFMQVNPENRIEWTFAEPDVLRAKLKQAPQPDIVISAAPDVMRLDASKPIARDPLVIVVTNANPAQFERAEDLNRAGLRVAIAQEDTMLGQATRTLIEHFRHDAAYGPDFPDMFYSSITTHPNNGRGVLNALLEHRADVGVVYASQANAEKKRTHALPIENGLNVPATYAVTLLTTRETARASRFVDYLNSSQAQTLWRDYGFEPMP